MLYVELKDHIEKLGMIRSQYVKLLSAGKPETVRRRKEKEGWRYYTVGSGEGRPQRYFTDRKEGLDAYLRYREYLYICKMLAELEKEIDHSEKLLAALTPSVRKHWESIQGREYSVNDYGFRPDGRIYKTRRGDKVRSKAEGNISDDLFENGVEYHYEKPVGRKGVHGDFTIPHSVLGVPAIWEHFGMMNDPEYAAKAYEKIRYYESMGFIHGINLITTYERYGSGGPAETFDSEDAERIVKKHFIP